MWENGLLNHCYPTCDIPHICNVLTSFLWQTHSTLIHLNTFCANILQGAAKHFLFRSPATPAYLNSLYSSTFYCLFMIFSSLSPVKTHLNHHPCSLSLSLSLFWLVPDLFHSLTRHSTAGHSTVSHRGLAKLKKRNSCTVWRLKEWSYGTVGSENSQKKEMNR